MPRWEQGFLPIPEWSAHRSRAHCGPVLEAPVQWSGPVPLVLGGGTREERPVTKALMAWPGGGWGLWPPRGHTLLKVPAPASAQLGHTSTRLEGRFRSSHGKTVRAREGPGGGGGHRHQANRDTSLGTGFSEAKSVPEALQDQGRWALGHGCQGQSGIQRGTSKGSARGRGQPGRQLQRQQGTRSDGGGVTPTGLRQGTRRSSHPSRPGGDHGGLGGVGMLPSGGLLPPEGGRCARGGPGAGGAPHFLAAWRGEHRLLSRA